jgi:glutaconate CoA-transferase subunit A
MSQAISQFVKPGTTLFLSGMQHGEPSAAVHEIVRQRIDHLTVVGPLVTTTGLLIGEGLIDVLHTGFLPQDEKKSYSIARARAGGKLPKFVEYSHYGISLSLFAGYMGLPFLPTRSEIGSDIAKYNPNIGETQCPFTGAKTGAVRALVPDVGILHVQRADAEGNAQKYGTLGMDFEGINACRQVIVTTEEIVDPDVIRRDPNRTVIPGFRVVAVVEASWGAHPMHLAGCYGGDQFGFNMEISKPEGYAAYLEKMVYGVKDWDEYMRKRREIKGDAYFKKLEIAKPVASDPIISGY